MRHTFTIVELSVTICIVGVVWAVAMPSVGKLLDRVHVRGTVLEIESQFSGPRDIAIARSAQTPVDVDTVNQAIYVGVGVDTLRKREMGKNHGAQPSATRVRMSYSATWFGVRRGEPQRRRATELVRRYRFCIATGSPAALIDDVGVMSTGSDSDATGTGVSDVVPKS